ncbi:MAG: TGS domain-containing protein, partial [Candidatus Bathyarchaeota archaeon]|nr:TGS domain-containing protein [Candidatus Bathyarchaeota archaeon]
ISGENSLEDIENAILENKKIYKSAIIIANKLDIKVEQNSKILKDKAFRKIPIVAVSCDTKKNTDEIGKLIFRSLEIIRIYTKEPGGEASVDMPFIMKNGSSVIKVAKEIHSDLFENFRYARIWGSSSKYPGEKVGRTHTLKDEDIVEVHTK